MIVKRFASLSLAPLAIALFAAAPAHAQLSAGAGDATVDLAPLLPMQGFGIEHDKLHARVLLLANGTARVALVSMDLTSMFDDEVAEVKRIVSAATRVDAANILVCASHTFSAPHVQPAGNVPPNLGGGSPVEMEKGARYRVAVNEAVTSAATAAARSLRPAHAGFASGQSDVNVNRNMETAEGWWLGADASGPSDKQLSVFKLDDEGGKPIAVLLNYAVQSSVMDQAKVGEAKAVTADLGGAAASYVEERFGGAVSIFLPGAAGDQAPILTANRYRIGPDGRAQRIDVGEKGYLLLDLLGERLGSDALRVGAGALRVGAGAVNAAAGGDRLQVVAGSVTLDALERSRGPARATRTHEFTVSGKTDAPFWIMRIGDIVIVGAQVELSASTGIFIKQHSPFPNTMVVTMVNGAAKYMPDAESYKRITYQALGSPYGPGSGEVFAGKIVDALVALRRSGGK